MTFAANIILDKSAAKLAELEQTIKGIGVLQLDAIKNCENDLNKIKSSFEQWKNHLDFLNAKERTEVLEKYRTKISIVENRLKSVSTALAQKSRLRDWASNCYSTISKLNDFINMVNTVLDLLNLPRIPSIQNFLPSPVQETTTPLTRKPTFEEFIRGK